MAAALCDCVKEGSTPSGASMGMSHMGSMKTAKVSRDTWGTELPRTAWGVA